MYIQYIVSCIKDKHVLKSKSTKARGVEEEGGAPKFIFLSWQLAEGALKFLFALKWEQ